MKMIEEPVTLGELRRLAAGLFGDMLKAVVDVEKGVLAVDAELHADLETELLKRGSRQRDLWGINLYPDAPAGQFVEFDSMINVRPSQNNRSRGVEDGDVRDRILKIVSAKVMS